ncbi:MAG: bifunctional phosphopantothenoylcysteine decarboxylase/phosphopantothenate--cysteine ligase CoaBC [bacterium]
MLKNKTIVLGVTGGIAAYKAATIASRLKDLGADVWVVMTDSATKLIGPATFRTLSGNPVITNLFADDIASTPVPHISLAEKADLILIAPCTANVIGKMAGGLADDALTTIVLASTAKKLLAPAMNCQMWQSDAVQKNINQLGLFGFELIGPEEGKLACGDHDIGRMSEPEEIVARIVSLLVGKLVSSLDKKDKDLLGKKILVTAGGTREAIDPIRYISNRSSGKMGYALAIEAAKRGAEVTLISAPTSLNAPQNVNFIEVESAAEMHTAVMENFSKQNVIIMAAAVADYRPAITFWQKLKKGDETFNLELSRTMDILAELGARKNGTCLVGFAAETNDHVENAKNKMQGKNLDLIIVNDTKAFESEVSEVKIIDKSGNVEELPELPKPEVAGRILDAILRL